MAQLNISCNQPWFWHVNFWAAVLHLANGILTTAFFFRQESKPEDFSVVESYRVWIDTKSQTYNASNYNCTQRFGEQTIQFKTQTSKFYLHWFIIAFHFLSAFFQFLVAIPDWCCKRGGQECCKNGIKDCCEKVDQSEGSSCGCSYILSVKKQGMNLFRFLEYSVSASLMMMTIAFVSGVNELYAQIGIFFLTFATQIYGLIAEYALSLYSSENIEFRGSRSSADPNLRYIALIAHFTGWITMMAAYGIVWRQFDVNVQKSEADLPGFVVVIVISLFTLYNIFGFFQFAQVLIKLGCCKRCCKDREDCCTLCPKDCKLCRCCAKEYCCGSKSTNVAIESLFVWNSLISKTLLGWVLYANLLVRDTQGVSEPAGC